MAKLLDVSTDGVDGEWVTLRAGEWKIVLDTADASTFNLGVRRSSSGNAGLMYDNAAGAVVVMSMAGRNEIIYQSHGGQVRAEYVTDDGGPVTIEAFEVPTGAQR